MKKTITVFVLCNLLTLSAFTGCSSASSNNSQPTTQVATSQTKSKTVDSVSEAESVLIEYLESNSYAIEQTLIPIQQIPLSRIAFASAFASSINFSHSLSASIFVIISFVDIVKCSFSNLFVVS